MEPERILFEIFIMFAAAAAAGELFRRLGQPALIGEILAGVVLGSRALGVIHDSEIHVVLQELGAIVLMFLIGLDVRPHDLTSVGGRAARVAVLGIIVPFGLGAGLVAAIGGTSDHAMFIGAAMVATSVGITARVLAELGVIHEVESRIILGAAILDDILGLLVLAVVSEAAGGGLSVLGLGVLAFSAVALVAIVVVYGHRAVYAVAPAIEAGRAKHSPLIAALALCLGLSALAGSIGLAAIIGAFLAGMALSEMSQRWALEEQVEPVHQLLAPFFFVVTGAQVDPGVFTDGSTLGLLAAVTALAVVGKLVGCGLGAAGLGRRSMAIVGMGMVPRGEVGIIVASVGLAAGMLDPDVYAVIVAMSIVTTIIAPPVLKALFGARVHTQVVERRSGETIEGV